MIEKLLQNQRSYGEESYISKKMKATTSTTTGTSKHGQGQTFISKKDPNFNMTLQDYEEMLGRILSQKGVRGVAVTSRDGEVTYYNKNIPQKMVQAYTMACLDTEYLCTVIARQNDPLTRLYYIRVETDAYEMVVSIENTHLAFMYCENQEAYNGENTEHLIEGDDDDEAAGAAENFPQNNPSTTE